MITTKRLLIWTLITHGLIVVGAGHGIMFLLIIEIITFPYLTKDSFNFLFNGVGNHFAAIGLFCLLGQIALLVSLFIRKKTIKNLFHLVGLILLWLSVIYFNYDSTIDSYIHISLFTEIPFAVCTIIAFLGQSISKFYRWFLDK